MAPRRRSQLPRLAIAWMALALLWLVLTGSTQPGELAVGAVAAAIGAHALETVQFRHLAQFVPLGHAFAQAWRLPRSVVVDTGIVLDVLARALAGEPPPSLLVAAPYSAVGDDDTQATLRALVIAYTTISPNSIVIDVDRERGLLLYHQMKETETPATARALGARA